MLSTAVYVFTSSVKPHMLSIPVPPKTTSITRTFNRCMVSAGFKSSFRFAPQSKTRTYLLNDSVESASQLSVLRQHAQKGVFHHSDVGGKNKGRGRHFLEKVGISAILPAFQRCRIGRSPLAMHWQRCAHPMPGRTPLLKAPPCCKFLGRSLHATDTPRIVRFPTPLVCTF